MHCVHSHSRSVEFKAPRMQDMSDSCGSPTVVVVACLCCWPGQFQYVLRTTQPELAQRKMPRWQGRKVKRKGFFLFSLPPCFRVAVVDGIGCSGQWWPGGGAAMTMSPATATEPQHYSSMQSQIKSEPAGGGGRHACRFTARWNEQREICTVYLSCRLDPLYSTTTSTS